MGCSNNPGIVEDERDDVLIVDTFPEFSKIWPKIRQVETHIRPEIWSREYMSKYPELLLKQINSYDEEGHNWRQIALKHVFPELEQRLPSMVEARSNILTEIEPSISECRSKFGFPQDLVIVIYVGIGVGAGWATEYSGKPAILFGLENIAECGWQSAERVRSLILHETGHLYLRFQRQGLDSQKVNSHYFELYSEGFAQRFEHLVLGRSAWYLPRGINKERWLEWCESHKSQLASILLDRDKRKEPINDFFGHWLNIEGWRQVGYYLGHEFITYLEATKTVQEIARLLDIDTQAKIFLKMLVSGIGE
jgi:hypothetical protein